MATSKAPTASVPSKADQAATATVPQRMIKAWAAHDSKAFGELFVEDGTLVLPGVFKKGRAEIAAFMKEGFAGAYKGSRVTGKPVNVKFLSDTIGLLITEGGVIEAGETELSDKAAIRASWLIVLENGTWQLTAYQNGPRDAV